MRVLLEYFHLQREIALEVAPSGEARVPASARRDTAANIIYHELAILIADYINYGLKPMRK